MFRLPLPAFVNSVFFRSIIVLVLVRYLFVSFGGRFRFGIVFA